MTFNIRKSLIGALITELIIDVMEDRGYVHISGTNSVFCAEHDWQSVITPLWISHELVGAAKIDRSTDDALFGRVKVFRINDLTWQNANPEFDDHRAVAQVEFLLPREFERTEGNLLTHNYVVVDNEIAPPILSDLIVRTGAEIL